MFNILFYSLYKIIFSPQEKVNAGLASAVAASGNMIVVGTSHGLVLGFDSLQTLRWCDQEARQQGSVSALEFNHDGTRLLAGFARGHILMIESANGKVLRTLTDVHPPGTAVLHLKVGNYCYKCYKMFLVNLFHSIFFNNNYIFSLPTPQN